MGKCPAAHGALQQRAAFIFGWRRPQRRTARPEGTRKEEQMNQQGMGPIARAAAAERMRETDAAARVRAEYEESPEYRIGCELLDGLTQELGISAAGRRAACKRRAPRKHGYAFPQSSCNAHRA